MPQHHCFKPATLKQLTLGLLACLCLPAAIQAEALQAGQVEFHIGKQKLIPALTEFAEQTGIQLMYNAELAERLNTAGITGRYAPQQALQLLLNGTGIAYRYLDKNIITLERQTAPQTHAPEPQSATTLPSVKVVGKTEYHATDPYNEDYLLPNATAGTKTDTPIMETPLNVQVISKQVLKDQQVTRIDQALKNVSGATFTGSLGSIATAGTDQNIILRGFNSQTYLRNGFRLQEGVASREFANVENIEVLKGSAAILYGQVEPGGVVNVITKQPQATPYYSAQQQFGSYDFYRTSVDATGPLTKDDSLLYRMNLSYENSGSFREFINNEKVFIAPVLKWNISPRTQATLEFEYTHGNLGQDVGFVPVRYKQFLSVPISRNYGDASDKNLQDTLFGGFNWSHQFNDDWSIKHSFAVNQQSTNRSAIVPSSVQEDLSVLRLPVTADSTDNTYSSNIDLTGHFDTLGLKHTLLLGGDYYRVDKAYELDQIFALSFIDLYNPTHSPTSTVGPIYKANQTTNTDQYGLYLQDQIKLPYNFHFTGGLRYQNIHQDYAKKYSYMSADAIPSLSADAITQREGLVWQPINWLSLYSNYTESFGPNQGTVYVTPSVSKSAAPSAAQQWEVGTKTEFFDGRLRATFAYYNLTKTNVTTGDPNPLHVGNILLTGEVRSRGPEVDIQGEILPGWNVIATYANTDVIVTKDTNAARLGSRMYGLPRNTGSLWNTYEFQQGELRGLKVGGGVTLRDSQLALDDQSSALDYLGNARVAGYSTVDLLAAYSLKLGKSKFTAQLNINNLLDKRYFTSAYLLGQPTTSAYDASYVSFGSPRTVMGSIKLEY